MLSLIISSLAIAGVSNALPSEHRRSHNHPRRAANYDVSNVDWNDIDWDSVFGKQPAAATTTSTTPAPQVAATTTIAQATAVATTTASGASATASTGSSSSPAVTGGKRGLAWDMGNDASLATQFEDSALSWVYNWNMEPSFSSDMQFVHQIKDTAALSSLASLSAGAIVFGFNEPDQSGLSAAEAASLYLSQVTPLKTSGLITQLGSPPVTNGGSGLPWLTEFMAACSECEIDFIAQHWYGPDSDMLESQLEAIHSAFPSLPLWVTEVGCTNWDAATNPSAEEISAFMSEAVAWFEATSWVAKWAWFGALPITDVSLGVANELLLGSTAGSSISALGSQYIA